jgi:hypothetical protein
MPQNPLSLTRQSLYDLVWSKPISDLAKDFNMSYFGLASRGAPRRDNAHRAALSNASG